MSLLLSINPILDHYVCNLKIPDTFKSTSVSQDKATFIAVIDSSGSMGYQTERITSTILPQVLIKLGYDTKVKHHIIDFNTTTTYWKKSIEQLQQEPIYSTGCTYISGVFSVLNKILKNNEFYRLLVISDGEIDDMAEAIKQASLTKCLTNGFRINAQSVRFFTSTNQPDTRALASFLQLNTITKSSLVDIASRLSDDTICKVITSLFNDSMDNTITLSSDFPIFKQRPWEQPTTSIKVTNNCTIWLTSLPEPDTLHISYSSTQPTNHSIPFKINIEDDVTIDNISAILSSEIEKHLNYLKVLKVVNSVTMTDEMIAISNYFTKLEEHLHFKDLESKSSASSVNINSIKHRCNIFKTIIERKKKSILQEFSRVANDDKVHKLNSANMASWLRNITVTKQTKSLARRATKVHSSTITAATLATGTKVDPFDFDTILRTEVLEMKAHINELDDIDSSEHNASFYSQATTLDGIKELCDMDANTINELQATEIIQLINIVGIACNANIGDYPDAMSWRAHNIFPGCYISISDLTYVAVQSATLGKKNEIYPPGIPHSNHTKITNVIPLFEEPRIHKFLIAYAPNLLEYTASVGMRRIISNIHMTYCYTLVGGLWCLTELLDKNKSTIAINSFKDLNTTCNEVANKHFAHVMHLIDKPIAQEDEDLSYFINNNGITNMINPIYNMVKEGRTKYLSNVIRSAYSYEASQVIRSFLKKNNYENRRQGALITLNDLLGIDYERYGNKPQEPFVPEPNNIIFHDKYDLNDKLHEQIITMLNKLDYVALLPDLFTCSVEEIKALPTLDDAYLARILNIDYDIGYFKLATIVQSLLFFNKKDRVDAEAFKMKVIDLGTLKNARHIITNFITSTYKKYYGNLLANKKDTEKKLMINKLVTDLVCAPTTNDYIKLFKDGVKYENDIFKISNQNSLGYIALQDELLNNSNIQCHHDKLEILFLGKHKDQIIWNNGNVLRVMIDKYQENFELLGLTDTFNSIKKELQTSIKHIYRTLPNRQGHSNNKPSYYAYGYKSMNEMKENVGNEFWIEYNKIHRNCCGNSL